MSGTFLRGCSGKLEASSLEAHAPRAEPFSDPIAMTDDDDERAAGALFEQHCLEQLRALPVEPRPGLIE